MDIETYALAKAYTDKEISGGGAIKGKNCVITEIEGISGGHIVHFQWTLDNGTVETDTMTVMDGEDGTVVSASETNGNIVIDGIETQVYDDSEIQDIITTDESTIEGNPINFSTLSAQTAQSTIIDLEPIQDLHGYDKPWVGGAGKNLCNPNLLVAGYYAANGSLVAQSSTTLEYAMDNYIEVSNTVYVAYVGYESGETPWIGIAWYDANKSFLSRSTSGNSSNTFDVPEGASYARASMRTYGHGTQYVLFSKTATPYEPYENICAITGRTQANILGTNGKESTDPDYEVSNDITISFGQTIYGAKLDVGRGLLVVDRGYKSDLGQLTWGKRTTSANKWEFYTVLSDMKLPPSSDYIANANCSIYKIISANQAWNGNNGIGIACGLLSTTTSALFVYDDTISELTDFQNAMSGVQLVYELATPITIEVTPHMIELLEGVNNISTDGDKITLTYRDGSVATLGDVKALGDEMAQEIADSQILTDTVTGDKYKLVVTSGVLSIEQISN